MKQWLLEKLRPLLTRLALWSIQYYKLRALVIDDSLSELVDRAKPFCQTINNPGLSGQYKRHWVYGQLVKSTKATRRDIAVAIELAVREL